MQPENNLFRSIFGFLVPAICLSFRTSSVDSKVFAAAVAVMVLKSDDITFYHGLSTGLKADSEAVGRDVGRSLQHRIGEDTKALFVFGDGLTINFDSFQRGVGETISKGDEFAHVRWCFW